MCRPDAVLGMLAYPGLLFSTYGLMARGVTKEFLSHLQPPRHCLCEFDVSEVGL